MTDYKNTLNLPQTGFPMKADLVTREPERLAQWETQRLYQKIQAGAPAPNGSCFMTDRHLPMATSTSAPP